MSRRVLLVAMVALATAPFAAALVPIVELAPPGTRLDDLPGAALLHPKKPVTKLKLKITPATIRV